MKIYVITEGDYSDYHIVGVTLDRKKAEAYCRECKCYEPLRGVCKRSSADPYEQEVMDPDDFCSSGERREEDDE